MFEQLQEMLRQRLGSPTVRTQQQIQNAPFRMYEDNSFQGDPSGFQNLNPGYRFWEDNTFTPPTNQVRRPDVQRIPGQRMVNPQFQQSHGSEGTAIQGRQYDTRLNPQGARQPRLQNAVNPQTLRLQ